MTHFIAAIAAALIVVSVNVAAQTKPAPSPSTKGAAAGPAAAQTTLTPPADYVIGPGDVLEVAYRDEKDMTGDRLVRPDGRITMPLIGDVEVVGLTPEQAKDRLLKLSTLFINPTISVGVKDINSRVVSITGGVEKAGQYKILAPMDVIQLISLAGGLREYTSGKAITIIRGDGAKQTSFKFNYKEVLEGKNLKQNIPLQPGDRVLVPE
ncbi:MAG: polysaccharide biosynthesis/export family protein [Vicinamibacterales bacterium]